jgi:hypothetical protein
MRCRQTFSVGATTSARPVMTTLLSWLTTLHSKVTRRLILFLATARTVTVTESPKQMGR